MPAVSFTRLDYRAYLRQWEIIRDCYEGEHQIKYRRERYLPRPNPGDMSEENTARYGAYLTRAVFYNVVKRTLNGLVGLLFQRDPVLTIPEELEIILKDADGSGANLIQLCKYACKYTVGYGRCGLFIDYPTADMPASKANIDAGAARPTIKVYEPWKIINWRTIFRQGLEILSLVVIEEPYVVKDDGFVVNFRRQWRVLRLEGAIPLVDNPSAALADNARMGPNIPIQDTMNIPAGVGRYVVDIYRDIDLNNVYEHFEPVDGFGQPIDTIPFIFIGSENNRAIINDPPLYDLATLNVGHYRNSADYEESTFITGQATPVFTGLTQAWVDGVLKQTMQLGSRGAIPLPVGADAKMLQAGPNGMVYEAMLHKEKQMVAIGANLIDTTKAPRTATESLIDDTNERSVLATAGDNVSDAFVFALGWCCRWLGIDLPDSPGIEFVVNTDFDLVKLTAQERQELILEWQAGAISTTELRENLKRGGIASQELEVYKADVKANPPPAPTLPTPPPTAGPKEPKLEPGNTPGSGSASGAN